MITNLLHSGKAAGRTIAQTIVPNRMVMWRARKDSGACALTFDDGPDPDGTPRVLDILASFQIHATFFLVGRNARLYPGLVRRIVDEGHEIGNHSQSHRVLTEIDSEEWIEEIEEANRTLEALTQRSIRYFRPPKGAFSLAILKYMVKRKKTTVLWSVDPKDFSTSSEDELRRKLSQCRCRGGDIILLHDRVKATVAVLPDWIQSLSERGIRFDTVGGLLQ